MDNGDRDAQERRTRRRWSVPIGRVHGVGIRVHVTFLALVALVAMAADARGDSVPGALFWLVVLFACVVVHEMAHAVVAQNRGVAVHEIDLLPIGGVSRLDRIPEDWRDEAAIAGAGPLASVALGVAALVAAVLSSAPLVTTDLWAGPFLARLAWVNLFLAAFNLLPAFPLDGGRVYRALLERSMTHVDATRRAARTSRAFAWGMIIAGVCFDVLLAVIGVFVLLAGRAEESAVLVHAALGSTPATDLAVPCPLVLAADDSVVGAFRAAAASSQTAFPVLDADGRCLGVTTFDALRRAHPSTRLGRLAMARTVDAGATLEEVVTAGAGHPVVVLREGRVVGVVMPEDLARQLQRRLDELPHH